MIRVEVVKSSKTGSIKSIELKGHALFDEYGKDIVCAAVYLHGRAGDIARDRVGERSMMARDIIDAISVSLENKSGGERYELQTC
jgi:NAD(P)H-hydrate repair Nnr-like enzyme with NAD(P)H-hydrate dehydratase domain